MPWTQLPGAFCPVGIGGRQEVIWTWLPPLRKAIFAGGCTDREPYTNEVRWFDLDANAWSIAWPAVPGGSVSDLMGYQGGRQDRGCSKSHCYDARREVAWFWGSTYAGFRGVWYLDCADQEWRLVAHANVAVDATERARWRADIRPMAVTPMTWPETPQGGRLVYCEANDCLVLFARIACTAVYQVSTGRYRLLKATKTNWAPPMHPDFTHVYDVGYRPMAWDPDTRRVILVTGDRLTPTPAEVWELDPLAFLDGATWTLRQSAAPPMARMKSRLLYDPGLGQHHMIGGITNSASGQPRQTLRDHWLYHAGTAAWTRLEDFAPPGATAEAEIVDSIGPGQLLYGNVGAGVWRGTFATAGQTTLIPTDAELVELTR
jgi:hypothetical protein